MQRRKSSVGPSVEARPDRSEIGGDGDSVPNDWLEVAIIFMALMSMIGAGSFLYHLSQQ